MRILVLGLGNPILRDDRVGLEVLNYVQQVMPESWKSTVELDFECCGGLRLMERLVGYDCAIVLDAICTGGEPGSIYCLSPSEIMTQRTAGPHDMNLTTAIKLGRLVGLSLPHDDKIEIVAVEAEDVLSFSEKCSEPVQSAVPKAGEKVLEILREWLGDR